MQQKRLINNSSQLNMFREIIFPIFRSTSLCVTVCGIMHPRCCRPVAHQVSCTMDTGSFPGVKNGRGVTLIPHPLLVPWL